MSTTERYEARLAIMHAWHMLCNVLGTLAEEGSTQALHLWEALPHAAPVGSYASLSRARTVARIAAPPVDARPEWAAYCHALAGTPAFGPAPSCWYEGAIAALDNGAIAWMPRPGLTVSTLHRRG